MTTQVECPHCQTINFIHDVDQWPAYHALTCESENAPGCSKPFVVRTTVEVKAEVYTLSKWEQKP